MFHLHACMGTTCVSGALGGQKKALGPLELELRMFVSHQVGAGNWTNPLSRPLVFSLWKRRFHVSQISLELNTWTWVSLTLWSSCIHLPSVGITCGYCNAALLGSEEWNLELQHAKTVLWWPSCLSSALRSSSICKTDLHFQRTAPLCHWREWNFLM